MRRLNDDNPTESNITLYRNDYKSSIIHRVERTGANDVSHISSTGDHNNVTNGREAVFKSVDALKSAFSFVDTCSTECAEICKRAVCNQITESCQKKENVVFNSDKMTPSLNFTSKRNELCLEPKKDKLIVPLDRLDASETLQLKQSIDKQVGKQAANSSNEMKSYTSFKMVKTELVGRKRNIVRKQTEVVMEMYTERDTDFKQDRNRNGILPVKRRRGRPRKNTIESEEDTNLHQSTCVTSLNSDRVQKNLRRPKKNIIKLRENKSVNMHQSNFHSSSGSSHQKKCVRRKKNVFESKENIDVRTSSFISSPSSRPCQKKRSRSRKKPFQIKDVNCLESKHTNLIKNKDLIVTNAFISTSIVMTRSKAALCGDAFKFSSLPTKYRNCRRKLMVETEMNHVNHTLIESPSISLRKENNQVKKNSCILCNSPTNKKQQPTHSTPIATTVEVRLFRCAIPSSTPYSAHYDVVNPNSDTSENTDAFCGFNEMELGDCEDRFKYCSSITKSISLTPIRTCRRMKKEEAAEKTQQYHERKKNFLNNSNGSRASKLTAIKRINSWITKPSPIPKHVRDSTINKSPLFNETIKSLKTPCIKLTKLSAEDISSYAITPLPEERIPVAPKTADDYGIDDVNTDDSTDDEEFPKKRVPDWCKNVRNGVLQAFKFQSAVPRSLVSLWMHPPKHKDSLHKVFFA